MNRVREALRAAGIFNTWGVLSEFGIAGVDDVALMYYPSDRTTVCGVRATSPSHETAPGSRHGRKLFVGNRDRSMPEAVAWAAERYGIKEWAPCPMDPATKIPLAVRRRALAFAKGKA